MCFFFEAHCTEALAKWSGWAAVRCVIAPARHSPAIDCLPPLPRRAANPLPSPRRCFTPGTGPGEAVRWLPPPQPRELSNACLWGGPPPNAAAATAHAAQKRFPNCATVRPPPHPPCPPGPALIFLPDAVHFTPPALGGGIIQPPPLPCRPQAPLPLQRRPKGCTGMRFFWGDGHVSLVFPPQRCARNGLAHFFLCASTMGSIVAGCLLRTVVVGSMRPPPLGLQNKLPSLPAANVRQ